MELRLDDVIRLDDPRDALRRAKAHLETHPDATVIAFVWHFSEAEPSRKLEDEKLFSVAKALLPALVAEKVVAAEPRLYPASVYSQFSGLMNAQVVTWISASLSVFKTGLLRDYLEVLFEVLGEDATVRDLSLYFNKLGMSSVAVPIPEQKLRQLSLLHTEVQPHRDWDEYVRHLDRFFSRTESDFFTKFARTLEPHENASVLIDASGLTETQNGTSRTVIGFLKDLDRALLAEEIHWNVTAVVGQLNVDTVVGSLSKISFAQSLTELEDTFDLGISLTPLADLERCVNLAQCSLRWFVLTLDVIALRSLPHLSQQVSSREALAFSAEFADEVITISNFSRNDARALLGSEGNQLQTAVLMGVPDEFANAEANLHPQNMIEDAVFVVGNDSPHKQTRLTVQTLLRAGHHVVSVSSQPSSHPRHTVIEPSVLQDGDLKALMLNAAVIVFPSTYEGFGLPTVEAASLGKSVIVSATEVNHELAEKLEMRNVLFFERIGDIPMLVPEAKRLVHISHPTLRRTSDFNRELRERMSRALVKPIIIEFPLRRWREARRLRFSAWEAELKIRQELHEEVLNAMRQRKMSRRILAKLRKIFNRSKLT